MDRRTFLIRSAMMAAGGMVLASSPALAEFALKADQIKFDVDLYKQFKSPDSKYHPYVRWWWNGSKVQAAEIVRELRLLKEAGIGGVEINPVRFPRDTDDLGIPALQWLSDEWIDMLRVAFDEAKKLDMTCDLIVGSGWPFGAEHLRGDEQGQMAVMGLKRIVGPIEYRSSKHNLMVEAEPAIGHPYPGRRPVLMQLQLVPSPLTDPSQIIDLTDKLNDEEVVFDVPKGNYVLYILMRLEGFAGVIMGAPGASGPSLNHLNQKAVQDYLDRMSNAIEGRIGPLKNDIRSLFTDSMELEGANWTTDFREEFLKRKGYDIQKFLPFTMWKVGSFGNVTDYNYKVDMSPEFSDMIDRMRYDYELVKAELFRERFNRTYAAWCNKLGVKSRAQAYGRGFFPLESSMEYDIPEGESWTTNWLQHRLGEEMGNEDYRRGRGYTMVDKFVSSGAHLAGKRWVSCEEMTNTYRVFNATLEFIKMGSDMAIISGITHSIWHGFNYSPKETEFPGWIAYGAYYSEKNNWWPYFKYLNQYKGRISSVLTNSEMFADIGVVPPTADMWTTMGVVQEPFPTDLNVRYTSLVWEAMTKHGNASDYLSEEIIQNSTVKDGKLCYGTRSYKHVFLIAVERTNPETLAVLYDFVNSGGQLFSIEKAPTMSLGWVDHEKRDAQVTEWMEKIRATGRYHVLDRAEEDDFMAWYPAIQERYNITPYVKISNPNVYVMQNRYRSDDDNEIFFICNSHLHDSHQTRVTFANEITNKRYGWVWDVDSGNEYRIDLTDNGIDLDLGPTQSLMIVFNKKSKGPKWNPLPAQGSDSKTLGPWNVELRYSLEDTVKTIVMDELKDLKETEYVSFSGTAVYRTKFNVSDPKKTVINLGKVFGVADVKINGQDAGIRWYGRRLYDTENLLKAGENELEISVITTMGNYMQMEMTDNELAQRWTNRPGRPQPVQSLGLAGPVTLYKKTETN